MRPVARNCGYVILVYIFSFGAVHAGDSVTACAIRWDAWYSNGPGDPASYTAAALSPPQFHKLAPIHASFDSSGKITWTATQETFDAEIRAAHGARLCWAYLMYGKDNVLDLDNSLMRGLALHRSSAIKSQVNYAIMTTSGLLGRAGRYQEAVSATVSLLHDVNYQRVSINGALRPLIYLFYDASDLDKYFGSSLPKMKEAIDSIRNSSNKEGLGNPYIVILYGPPEKAEVARAGLGADAISAYVAGKRKPGVAEPWAEFEPSIEADWNAYASATAANVVPTLRSGADIRARCQNPPPFDHRFSHAGACNTYTINPTTAELEKEFRDAKTWVNAHQSKDPGGVLLVYAWSECDESGNCLMPTVGDPGGSKLSTISAALR